jgi:hypothetical protein
MCIRDSNKAVGGRGLWEKFVISSLEVLKDDKYLCIVHPQGWRRPESKIGGFLKIHEFIFLKTNSTPFKGIGVTVDYYVLKKNNNGQYKDLSFIPNDLSNLSVNITKKILENQIRFSVNKSCKYGSSSKLTSRTKTDEFEYTIYHTNIQFIYSKQQEDYFTKSKIIVSDSGKFKPFYDSGEYGISEHSMYYFTNKEDSEKILTMLNSKLTKWFLYNNKVGNFMNDWKLINFIPLDDINLTGEEIKFIEEFIDNDV